MKYRKVAVGGTFDYLHDGHKEILRKAFEIGERVSIGITSDRIVLKKDSVGIQPFEKRVKKLEELLREMGWIRRAEIVKIADPAGTAGSDGELEAIVVSKETRPGAERINEIRSERGLKLLDMVEVPFVLAEDGEPISSIRIRYGEMDVHGKLKKRRRSNS